MLQVIPRTAANVVAKASQLSSAARWLWSSSSRNAVRRARGSGGGRSVTREPYAPGAGPRARHTGAGTRAGDAPERAPRQPPGGAGQNAGASE